ncbi:class I SAM-dependent methyltransferase [Micromonospora sp. C28SCA-DRY-2]|uniref:class I SAM-dependent methyltransferase n=1 Tax=Micromonospora sp. C28SCA-DRY-2 TaxID=3059522 RepID=UPI002676DD4E|nr:class I SAM-dependent methyltransferase [Micromonospora sp. C28SCA-DRY-2]MDO3705697.1 class I SAM-dependent methyltransferase [Micromonospora sp. C28SCA-DRY-2]
MTGVFGDVADLYDDARPGYPATIAEAIRAYHGGAPTRVVELGAGTGKATEVLLRLDAPITCVEPDPRMAAVLATRYPQVTVVGQTFEQWQPPAGGVPLIACALAWHWLDPATRNQRAHAALTSGGTLAVFGHKYGYADPAQGAAVDAALRAIDPTVQERPAGWFAHDITDSGLFTDIRVDTVHRDIPLRTDGYLRLLQTFGPYRQHPAEQQARALTALRSVVDGFGGTVVLRLCTTLVLARRPHR